MDTKSNETPALQDLLNVVDVHGAVVTVYAMYTQQQTAAKIRAVGALYVFTVKSNQKLLHAALKNLPWKDVPARTTRDDKHGRAETRTIKVLDKPDWIEFADAAQVAQPRRTTRREKSKGSVRRKSVEVVYLITSADHRTAQPRVWAQMADCLSEGLALLAREIQHGRLDVSCLDERRGPPCDPSRAASRVTQRSQSRAFGPLLPPLSGRRPRLLV